MKTELCMVGTEAELTQALAAVDKAMGFPSKGARAGRGHRRAVPDTWDGTGPCPPGWTATASRLLVKTANDAALPIGDFAAELPSKLAALTTAERAVVESKLSTAEPRDMKDSSYTPKAVASASK